jgi:type 1 fimbria pilin
MHHSPIAALQGLVHRNRIRPSPPLWGVLLIIFLTGLLGWPTTALAQAQCYFQNGNGDPINAPPVQTVTFDSVTIPLPSPAPTAGSNIGPPRTATASSGIIYIACPNGGTPGGLQPSYGTYNATNNTIYSPTPGVAFQILRSGTSIPLYPNGPLTTGTTQFTNTTTFQLISTGVLPSNGNQIPKGTVLGQWQFNDLCTSPIIDKKGRYKGCNTNAAVKTVITFLSGGVTFTASTCSVSTGSQNVTVTLPSVAANTLGAVGATAGMTPFGIILTGCSSNLSVSATLSSNNPYIATNGVIAPTTGAGYASGVGVQILQPDGATPVTFDTAFPTGTTNGANSNYTFSLYARYYQTAAPVTPGQVQAAATYTLTYQ